MEAIFGLESWNLSVGELGSKLGLFVVFEVCVLLRQVDGEASKGRHSTNLVMAEIRLEVDRSEGWANVHACRSPAGG